MDIVSAHSVSNDMTICTEMCEEKSNEIKTDPSVIGKSVHEGDIVTLDAMGCQENIIKVIKARKAHFLIEVKANQKKLRWGVEDRIKSATPIESYTSEPSLSSGRISVRRCKTYSGVDVMVDKDNYNILIIRQYTPCLLGRGCCIYCVTLNEIAVYFFSKKM